MIKTSAMFSAHAIHVLLRNTLIFFVVLFIALFVWLNVGIQIDSFKISKYHVDGLYIKLDKKLILKAQKVTIPQSKADPSSRNIGKTFGNIKYLLTFFEHIDLKEIDFNNNVLAIYYLDNILQVSTNDYLIRGNIHREGKMLKGNVPILELKKKNIVLRGEFSYDLHEDILETKGKFLFQKVAGNFEAVKNKKEITFSLRSDVFSDLRAVVKTFHLPSSVESWVVDKVRAKTYTLQSLEGKGKIRKKGFSLDKQSIKAKALLNDVEIDFQKGLEPVHAKNIILTYSLKEGLLFDLSEPTYMGRDLNGSQVSIGGLGTKESMLSLDLHLLTPFDEVIQNILKSYDLEIPIHQSKGDLNGTLQIDIGLNYHHFNIESLLAFSQSDIRIGNVPFHILKGKIVFVNNDITLKDISLKEEKYEGVLNGTLDVKKHEAKLVLDAKNIHLKAKDKTLFLLKNTKLPFSLDYKNDLSISIPKLSLLFTAQKEKMLLELSDLRKIKPYVEETSWFENGGNLEFTTKDFSLFDFKGVIKPGKCFIYEDKDSCKTRIPFHGTVTEKNVKFYAFDKRISYNKLKSRVNIKDLNIDLKVFLQNSDKPKKMGNKEKKKKKKKTKKEKNIIIVGKNSNLRYDEYSLILDSYDVEVTPRGNIKAIGSCLGDIIKFSKKKNNIEMQALRIKDAVLHPLINFNGLQKGRYSIKKEGDPEKVMKGQIIIEGGVMRDFKAYNNTAAFVNTVPALASLHKPGYSKDGFEIEEGVIEYRMIERKRIIFDSIYIRGASATLVGKGELDLTKKTMDIDLAIQVARDIGKVLGSVPLVGYILMGEEKSITVGLKISGTLRKPVVQTSAVKDILSSPLGIIKRTFESPNHIINQPK